MLRKTILAGAGKGRSEEQINTPKFSSDFVKKALKEKSQSSSALKVGPFAAIKESEKRKKKNGSLDTEENSVEETATEGPATEAKQRQRATTETNGGGAK